MAENFPGLRPEWAENQRKERLLGVDLNGQMDSRLAQDPAVQRLLADAAYRTNKRYAKLLGINQSAAITTVKPSGNASQLLDTSSGIHPRWSPYYIRHIRFNSHSPVKRLLADQGMPMFPENGYTAENTHTWVAPFPVKAPAGAITRNVVTALGQLRYVAQVRQSWTEHQPSVTITYRPEELEDIIGWVLSNKPLIAGLSFLPASDHTYPLAPYVEVTKGEYEALAAALPDIDFSRLSEYEAEDYTEASQEIACAGGVCDFAL
jgi:ribonucleoside-triphosphate reductase